MGQRFTRKEAGRILGVAPSRLRYWERLQLVKPQARWGERFYSFSDLVALKTLKRLTGNRIPARRVRRVVELVEQQFGESPLPLEALRLLEEGRDVLVIPPGIPRPFNPVRQQWVLPFMSQTANLHTLAGRTAEELFETALEFETIPESLSSAVENYRQVIDRAPDWIEAHINLGVALYQMGRAEEAQIEFLAAVEMDPLNGIAQYNLGCVLEERGEVDTAIRHLVKAARALPAHADVHFNLALAYEKKGDMHLAREEWKLYLRYAPSGPWAEQARARLKKSENALRKPPKPIPFPARR